MSYIYLFIAIIGELLGTTLLKVSEGFSKPLPGVSALLSYGVCFFFLSKKKKKIPLGITYATWSGVGLLVTAVISILVFNEKLNLYTIIGLGLIIVGVLMVNLLGNAGH